MNKKTISLKQFLLVKALPGQLAILLFLSTVLVSLFFWYSKPRIELEHANSIDAISSAVDSSVTQTLSQLHNLARNDFVINSLVEPEQRRYYLPLFFQSLRINNDDEASIAFYDFEAQLLASKNIAPLEQVLSTYQWREMTLEHAQEVIEIDTRGVFIAIPVFFSEGFVEGAIVFYSASLERLVEYKSQRANQVITDASGVVLYSSGEIQVPPGQHFQPDDLSGIVVKRSGERGLYFYSFESYREAYTTVLYLLPFVGLSLLSALLASLFSTQLSARIGSATLRKFGKQIQSGFNQEYDGDEQEKINELNDIELAFDDLMRQVDQLSLSNDKVTNVINALWEFLVVIDDTGKLVLLNDSCKIFIERASLQETDLIDLFTELNTDSENTGITGLERRYHNPRTGETAVIHWYATTLPDNHGRGSGSVLVGEDLTLRRNLESDLLLKTQAVDRASTSILISDVSLPGQPIIYINEACLALTGYAKEDFIGNNCRFLQGPDTNKKDIDAIRDAIQNRLPLDITLLNYKKDGSEFYNQLTLTPIENDEGFVTHYLGLLQDVTAREQTAQYLQRAKLKAEESSRLKADFLANMSHEIRTPINGIYGVLQSLDSSELNKEQHKLINLALLSTRNLLHIINDILDISKIEAGKLSIEKIYFDPVELIASISQSYKMQCAARELAFIDEVNLPTDLLIESDPIRIRQVIENLLSNALKFTKQGHIRIESRLVEKGSEGVFFLLVEDSGIGIAEDKIKTIFEQFSQEDLSTTRKFGGTGLGLSISQKLCELMGGQIKVTSKKDCGSKFAIRLPVKIVGKSDVAPADEEIINSLTSIDNDRKLTILLVEDNEINQVIALQQLAVHQVTTADNGKLALETLRDSEQSFDIVLMDCQMPEMDGFEAARQIRAGAAGEAAKSVPLIALTANAMHGDKELCLQAGMDDYLSKPFEAEVLAQKLRYWSIRKSDYKQTQPEQSD